MDLKRIFNDDTLYGHGLTSLPEKIWKFRSEASYYWSEPKSVGEANFLGRRVTRKRGEDCYTSSFEFFFEKPIFGSIEQVVRKVLGPLAAGVCCLTAVPIGFVAKMLHLAARHVVLLSQSVWDDATLYGHALTSLADRISRLASLPLGWHLRSNGTDRRERIISFEQPKGPSRKGDLDGRVCWTQEEEYDLVPFELFETLYRRVLGGSSVAVIGSL